ncbi:MAG: aldehyde dehydrogenase family protein, partial [Desulfobacteraceae bacterium]|nr:aldehyde dehydrogenase family protein [Desulfobacteraceae bacterium]
MLSCGCWIHGEEKSGGKRYPLTDPATAEVFGQGVDADAKLVDEAVESAREGFNGWRMLPVACRAELLHALARRICREVEEMADLLRQEVGKPLKAARDEVLKTATHLDYFAEESRRQEGRIPLLGNPREQVLIVREPVGVVAAITPYNYPLSTLACKLAPALAVGCSVVAKPDEHTPLSTVRLARLASEEGFPPGVFNVITGFGPGAGRLLVNHPLPRLVTFTGSTETGKEILAVCSKYVRKAVMELGGNCPAII